jgi:hypothetical protein
MRRIDQDSHSRPLRARNPLVIRAAFATAVIASVITFFACSGGGDDAPEFESQPLSPELQAMLDDVAEIRGLPSPTNVRIGAIPRDRVAEFIDSRYSDEDRAELDHLTLLYRLQGHLSSTRDFREVVLQLFTDFGIGFYSPEDRTMWLVRDSIESDPANLNDVERSTLAHEFVHAIQDNAFDIERIEAETADIDDGALAHAAVIEGDAVAHERLWLESQLAAGRTALSLRSRPRLGRRSTSHLRPASHRRGLPRAPSAHNRRDHAPHHPRFWLAPRRSHPP